MHAMELKATSAHEPARAAAHDDLALVRAAQRGGAAATDQLFARLGCVARMLAARNAELQPPLPAAELEDLVQETLFALWRKLAEYDGRGRIEAWAFGFAVLELHAQRRRTDRFRGLLSRAEAQLPRTPELAESGVFAGEDVERVHAALAGLERADADVVRLKHFDELSFEAIAARLAEPASTVKTRYYRALARLRFQLRASADLADGVERDVADPRAVARNGREGGR